MKNLENVQIEIKNKVKIAIKNLIKIRCNIFGHIIYKHSERCLRHDYVWEIYEFEYTLRCRNCDFEKRVRDTFQARCKRFWL